MSGPFVRQKDPRQQKPAIRHDFRTRQNAPWSALFIDALSS